MRSWLTMLRWVYSMIAPRSEDIHFGQRLQYPEWHRASPNIMPTQPYFVPLVPRNDTHEPLHSEEVFCMYVVDEDQRSLFLEKWLLSNKLWLAGEVSSPPQRANMEETQGPSVLKSPSYSGTSLGSYYRTGNEWLAAAWFRNGGGAGWGMWSRSSFISLSAKYRGRRGGLRIAAYGRAAALFRGATTYAATQAFRRYEMEKGSTISTDGRLDE
ncbi:hypothetical protein BJ170DRAFT_170617 [Xylariales sp. AK1849]|nr:hypothetical protein BJ170DRAFT_170617 [Xylariales sp. AK1849]